MATKNNKSVDFIRKPLIILSRGCSCGKKMRVCAICGNWYCPKCDYYHLENCRDQMKGGE